MIIVIFLYFKMKVLGLFGRLKQRRYGIIHAFMSYKHQIIINCLFFIPIIHFTSINQDKASRNRWITVFYILFLLMENYELFWNNQINSEGYLQLVLDWDVFITNFSSTIAKYAHYELNQTQKEFIKVKIDPKKTNQIYKNAFLLFAQEYWDIPSNRTNLFKMKMNLSNVLPRFKIMTRISIQKLTFSITYVDENKQVKSLRYEYRQNALFQIDDKGYEKQERKVQENGFISIGASSQSDVTIQDSLFINKNHLKIASTKKIVKSAKKRSYFEQKQQQNIEVTEWFVRDTSRSNRLRYLLDKPHKYVFVKQNMVVSFGLTGEFQLHVKLIDSNLTDFLISKLQQQQIQSLLNADRINFMGEIDPNVPLKTTLQIDFKEVTPKEVEEMFKQKEYYPPLASATAKGGDKKDAPSLNFVIFNRRTHQSLTYTALQPSFTIGRSKTCKYRIDHIGVREKELVFRCINGFWLVSNPQPFDKPSFQVNQSSVFLTTLRNIEEGKVSNRIQICEGYPYRLRGKQFEIQIQLTQPKNEEEQY